MRLIEREPKQLYTVEAVMIYQEMRREDISISESVDHFDGHHLLP